MNIDPVRYKAREESPTIDSAALFAALANQGRLRCLHLLLRNEDVCVCEVVAALEMGQPTASKALNQLKAIGLLSDRKDANWVYYSLNPALPSWVTDLLRATQSGLEYQQSFINDQHSFSQLELRNRAARCA